jgi:cytochrome c-type biogenesis protein CcmH
MIWIVFALLTGAAVLSVLWPLTGPPPETGEDAADVAFYRAQIAEIDAETSHGGVSQKDAEAAKAQAGRRLLAAADEQTAQGDAPFARNFALVLVAFGVPAIALGVYSMVGRPNLPDMPLQARLNVTPARPEVKKSIAEMEAQLAAHPNDGRTLELMTPTYLEMGRYDDAVKTSKKAIEILGESPARLVKYAEALSYANDGVVSPEAMDQLERALKLDPKNLLARYYLGLAAAQHDDADKARSIWTAMLPELPGGSKAKKNVLDKLALLAAPPDGAAQGSGPDAAGIAAKSPDEQQKMIRAMVDNLAQRLATKGGNADDWARLIRSYKVLNAPAKAQDAYDRALKAFPDDGAARSKLAALAQELGLSGN